jgi:hypothetical protein
MSEIQILFDLYLSLIKELREVEEVVVKQTEVMFAQSRAIFRTKSRLDDLIEAYHKLLEKLSVGQNKEFDKKVEEVIDIVTSRQKYKM